MPGISDSNQPDDLKLHLERILEADDARQAAPEGESEDAARQRQSVALPGRLRSRAEQSLAELSAQAPGLTAAETTKLLATRAGRDALEHGIAALTRVDDHLQSVTGQRTPVVGKNYGVFGQNPTSFGGVVRSLELSATENARIAALPEGESERDLLFTPLIQHEVESARDELARMLGTRLDTRASLSRAVSVKGKTLDDAKSAISAVRSHLYANLPHRNQDDDLRDYGFRPIRTRGRAKAEPVATDPAAPDPAGPES